MKEYFIGIRNRLSDFLRVLSDELYVDDGIGDVINADTRKICFKLRRTNPDFIDEIDDLEKRALIKL